MSAGRPFLACACFFSDNIFVGRYGLHVRYRDEAQLRREHGRVTAGRGHPQPGTAAAEAGRRVTGPVCCRRCGSGAAGATASSRPRCGR